MPCGSPGMGSEVKTMGLIPTVSEDGDIVLGRDVVEREIREKEMKTKSFP